MIFVALWFLSLEVKASSCVPSPSALLYRSEGENGWWREMSPRFDAVEAGKTSSWTSSSPALRAPARTPYVPWSLGEYGELGRPARWQPLGAPPSPLSEPSLFRALRSRSLKRSSPSTGPLDPNSCRSGATWPTSGLGPQSHSRSLLFFRGSGRLRGGKGEGVALSPYGK